MIDFATLITGVREVGYYARVNTEDGIEERYVHQGFKVSGQTTKGYILDYIPSGDSELFETRGEAELVAQKALSDKTEKHWAHVDTVYGSEVWGDDDEYELACFEADCFGEPRPRGF